MVMLHELPKVYKMVLLSLLLVLSNCVVTKRLVYTQYIRTKVKTQPILLVFLLLLCDYCIVVCAQFPQKVVKMHEFIGHRTPRRLFLGKHLHFWHLPHLPFFFVSAKLVYTDIRHGTKQHLLNICLKRTYK